MKVTVKRHIAKTISYRIVGSLQTMVIGYVLTGSFVASASIGFAELLIKPFIYFLHERVWYKWIRFGLRDESEINNKKECT